MLINQLKYNSQYRHKHYSRTITYVPSETNMKMYYEFITDNEFTSYLDYITLIGYNDYAYRSKRAKSQFIDGVASSYTSVGRKVAVYRKMMPPTFMFHPDKSSFKDYEKYEKCFGENEKLYGEYWEDCDEYNIRVKPL